MRTYAVKMPGEDEVREAIETVLKPELDIAGEVLNAGLKIFTSGMTVEFSQDYSEQVFALTMGLLAKACKQYRAVCELVMMGLGGCADSNARMLFESMLAIAFLTRERIEFKWHRKDGEDEIEPPAATLRGLMYLANEIFQSKNIDNVYEQNANLKGQLAADFRARLDESLEEAKGWLGPAWSRRVKEKGYAGVHISDLAAGLGFSDVYASVYKITSSGVHAADAMSHVVLDKDTLDDLKVDVYPKPGDVPNTLAFATMVMVQIIREVDARLYLGLEQWCDEYGEKTGTMRTEVPELE